MRVDLLRIENLRNIDEVEIYPNPGINYFIGNNGTGKTSILEALFVLARARTFRSAGAKPLIKQGLKRLDVFAKVSGSAHSIKTVGVSRKQKGWRIRLNSKNVLKLSQLARSIPVQIISTQSHRLFELGPSYRRRYIDWGVFHVEHTYHQWYARYVRILKQRNAFLRQGGLHVGQWDEQLIEANNQIDRMRRVYLDALIPSFKGILGQLLLEKELSAAYYPGWIQSKPYEKALKESFLTDSRRGFTTVGVHCADIKIRLGSEDAASLLSRGQQKAIVSALLLAQATLQNKLLDDQPIILWDDMAAEFDQETVIKFIGVLEKIGFQVFANSTQHPLNEDDPGMKRIGKVFHVEHGTISEL